MDTYTSCVDTEFDSWFLQPGDIIHHYMISTECVYNSIRPMVALRDTCSFLTEQTCMDSENGEEDDMMMEAEEDLGGVDDIAKEVHREHKKGRNRQKIGQRIINRLLSMISSSDISSGKCRDMAYITLTDNAQASAMHIPNSILFNNPILEYLPKEGCASTNQESEGNQPVAQAEEHDNLYDIYPNLAVVDERQRECLEIDERHIDRGGDKGRILKLETYRWMRDLADMAVS